MCCTHGCGHACILPSLELSSSGGCIYHATSFPCPCTLCVRPSRWLRYRKTSKTSRKERSQALSLLPTRRVFMFSCLCVLVRHGNCGLGSMSSSSQWFNLPCISVFLCCRRIASKRFMKKESVRPRVVPRANSQCGLQDLPTQKARSSQETQSDAQSFREIGCNVVDYRIPGTSISTVQEQDEHRQHKLAQLIEMFESHKHKDQFLKHMSQTKKIKFSEASQELLKDMNHTDIFELCENSKKLQLSQTAASFSAVAGEIWSIKGVSHNFKKTTTISQFDRWLRH